MTFKHINFGDSIVMRSLEKVAMERGMFKDEPVVKEASAETTYEPTDDLLNDMCCLADGLREKGFIAEATTLEDKIFIHRQAAKEVKKVKDDGEKMLDEAHPEGDVEVAPSKGGYGKMLTQKSTQDEIKRIVNKMPTGKLAHKKAQLGREMVVKQLGIKMAVAFGNAMGPHLGMDADDVADTTTEHLVRILHTDLQNYPDSSLNTVASLFEKNLQVEAPGWAAKIKEDQAKTPDYDMDEALVNVAGDMLAQATGQMQSTYGQEGAYGSLSENIIKATEEALGLMKEAKQSESSMTVQQAIDWIDANITIPTVKTYLLDLHKEGVVNELNWGGFSGLSMGDDSEAAYVASMFRPVLKNWLKANAKTPGYGYDPSHFWPVVKVQLKLKRDDYVNRKTRLTGYNTYELDVKRLFEGESQFIAINPTIYGNMRFLKGMSGRPASRVETEAQYGTKEIAPILNRLKASSKTLKSFRSFTKAPARIQWAKDELLTTEAFIATIEGLSPSAPLKSYLDALKTVADKRGEVFDADDFDGLVEWSKKWHNDHVETPNAEMKKSSFEPQVKHAKEMPGAAPAAGAGAGTGAGVGVGSVKPMQQALLDLSNEIKASDPSRATKLSASRADGFWQNKTEVALAEAEKLRNEMVIPGAAIVSSQAQKTYARSNLAIIQTITKKIKEGGGVAYKGRGDSYGQYSRIDPKNDEGVEIFSSDVRTLNTFLRFLERSKIIHEIGVKVPAVRPTELKTDPVTRGEPAEAPTKETVGPHRLEGPASRKDELKKLSQETRPGVVEVGGRPLHKELEDPKSAKPAKPAAPAIRAPGLTYNEWSEVLLHFEKDSAASYHDKGFENTRGALRFYNAILRLKTELATTKKQQRITPAQEGSKALNIGGRGAGIGYVIVVDQRTGRRYSVPEGQSYGLGGAQRLRPPVSHMLDLTRDEFEMPFQYKKRLVYQSFVSASPKALVNGLFGHAKPLPPKQIQAQFAIENNLELVDWFEKTKSYRVKDPANPAGEIWLKALPGYEKYSNLYTKSPKEKTMYFLRLAGSRLAKVYAEWEQNVPEAEMDRLIGPAARWRDKWEQIFVVQTGKVAKYA